MSKKLLSPMKKLLPILALFSLVFLVEALPAHAQTGEIAGTVTDSTSGEALPGVNVVVVGTQTGNATDVDGEYTIPGLEPGTYDLRASFVGYEQQMVSDVSVSAGETTEVNFILVPGAMQLEEVVAVGYGTQRTEEVTGSVSTVEKDDFIEGSARDAGELIENQIAGLNVSQSSGNPDAGSNITLRGVTTLNASSSPLILIDGVPGSLRTVSQQDIESIDVLKGGSAAAIYGSRASNGVVLITTKSPDGNEPTRINYSADVSTQRIKEEQDVFGADELRSLKEQFSDTDLPIASVRDFGGDTDWQDEVQQNPVSTNQRVALSGGDASTDYRASFEWKRENGIILRSDNEDVTGRVSIDHSMYDGDLQINANLTGRFENDWSGINGSIWKNAVTRNPTDSIRNDEGAWQERSGAGYSNPLGLIHEANGRDDFREWRMDAAVTLSPLNNVELSLLGSGTKSSFHSQSSTTFDHVSTTKRGLDGTASQFRSSNEELLLEATGTYDDEIGNHDFDVLGGYSWQENTDENFSASNRDFPVDPDILGSNNLSVGNALTDGEANMNSGKSSWTLIGFFGRANYTYDNRYILSASFRYEGDSRFGENNEWGNFPSVSGGWRVGEEAFMQDVSFLDRLKLRAGFGVTGISPGAPFQSLASFGFGGSFFNDGEWVQGLEPVRNANPDLRWERKEEINIGLDFTILNDRLSGTLDVYRRTTEDLLFDVSVPVPPFLFDTITANIGELENEGIEASLNYEVLQTEDISWSTDATFSTNRNELKSLSSDRFQPENDFVATGYLGGPIQQATHRTTVGGPIGNFWGYKTLGVNEEGTWVIEGTKTVERDGEEVEVPSPKLWTEKEGDERQKIGNGVPDYRISWNHSVRVGNFDARVTMGGEFGHQILNKSRTFLGIPGNNAQNYLEGAFDEKDVVRIEEREGQPDKLVQTDEQTVLTNREALVDANIEDGDYWKIESITVGYSFDALADLLSNARVYLTGRNLVTFTGYSGLDPEVNTGGLSPGVEQRFKFPTTRTFTAGVDLTF
jgi:TonB-linked SusC/RagA family outer membrane protein